MGHLVPCNLLFLASHIDTVGAQFLIKTKESFVHL